MVYIISQDTHVFFIYVFLFNGIGFILLFFLIKALMFIPYKIISKISDIFKKLGIEINDGYTVLDGGPSMGKVINPATYTVRKTTKGILILPNDTEAIRARTVSVKMAVARAETACCQCTRCTDMCPRFLLGYPLEPHKMVRTAMGVAEVIPEMVVSATLCCGCGICESLACSQGISPRAVIESYKALLAKNKLRFNGDGNYEPRDERDYRMIPYKKWMSALGVTKFDKIADYGGEINGFARVEIPLSGHIGAPSIPSVIDGDTVKAGDLIAKAADGLSLPQHASIDGTITLGINKIIIDKVR